MSEASPAATVVILREGAGTPELLLTERHGKLGFAGGAMVFPGGKVDDGDLGIARDPELACGFEALADTDAAARIAAAREAFEEVGILLSAGPALDAATVAEWRARFADSSDEAGTYAAFLRACRHRADAARLTPFAHWVPPAGLHRRFDTLFYIAVVPAGTEALIDGTEAVAAHWTTAAAACADTGHTLIFPTRRNLERLAQYDSVVALLATLDRPPTRIEPRIVERDGAQWLTIPEGCDYPVTEERLERSQRG
ncbi:NUDIX domain-containing protein [Glacieibacterium frigidum]|uniref:NUDIX domain-containing protein n=1 Tax=Glacieibacterium frigidum TaxID=2593303 RepID=A0A552UIM0_9SPHN|nr:NUDIX domain-containing protein [Glacieibacterium frigidum]TRW18076.1 NUDIX domain-containing protein [Glacieibacterium frigidum]